MKMNMIAYLKMRMNPVEYYADMLLKCYRKRVKYARRERWLRLYNYFNKAVEDLLGDILTKRPEK